MIRRRFIQSIPIGGVAALARPFSAGPEPQEEPAARPPNIILIVADDLGYGDLGCYGSNIRTPNLDQMANDGVLFRQFYAASPVCSPSRAALMTGRYGVRSGVPYVLGPEQKDGLALTETTLADTMRTAGYKTMCIGKWHLGAYPQYLPTARGFDEYYGLPYSNDNSPSVLLHNTEVIESPVVLETVTRRYTQQAAQFIRNARDTPFFLYLAHTLPHIPLASSPPFSGRSPLGPYGDAVEELDWSVGQLLAELDVQGLSQNTLVLFTSDNGPWFQGSPGRLRGRKGDTFEGGMRVPFLARLTGTLPPGRVVQGRATALDVLPTLTALTGAAVPENPLDGVNIWSMLTGEADFVNHPLFLYFSGYSLQCARMGRWKLHLARANGPAFAPQPAGGRMNLRLAVPELYDMDSDPEEGYDVASQYPTIARDIRSMVVNLLPSLPVAVQSAWQNTMYRDVDPVNAGEWPSA